MANPAKVRTASGTWVDLAVQSPDISNYSTTTQMNTAIDNAKGMILINKTDFTSASQIDITNCFSPTYQNYLMTTNISSASIANYALFQLLNGTTPATSTYYFAYAGFNSANGTANAVGASNSSNYFIDYATSGLGLSTVYFNDPNKVAYTSYTVDIIYDNLSGAIVSRRGGGVHYTSASYNGIRIFPNGGTITGTIRIYGFRNS